MTRIYYRLNSSNKCKGSVNQIIIDMTSKSQEQSISPKRVLLPAGLGTTFSLLGDSALYTVLPTHTIEAGIELNQVGIILSINRFVRLLLNSVAGVAYDHSPRRRLFLASLLIGVISTVFYAVSQGFWSLFLGRILWGLAWSGIWVGGSTIILDITHYENRGRWTGYYQIWFYLGGVLGAVISGVATDWLGYTPMLWIAAALGMMGWLVSFIFLPETRHDQKEEFSSQHRNNNTNYLSNPTVLLAAFLHGSNRFASAGVLSATFALLVQDYIINTDVVLGVATLTGLLSGFRMIVSMTASPLVGILSDRVGNRWMTILVMLLLCGVSMVLIVEESWLLFFMGIILASMTTGGLQTLTTAVVGDEVSSAQRGKAISILYTSGDLGSALGPIVAYALLPTIGLRGVYWICTGLFFIGMPITLWQARTKLVQ